MRLLNLVISDKQQEISIVYVQGYKKLIAWQKSDQLASAIYVATLLFPQEELYGITSQLKRAALSVPLNIIEGYARINKNEFRHFLSIALGSLAEVEYLLYFSKQHGLIKQPDYDKLLQMKEECGRIIWRLHQSQKSEKR